MSKRAPSPASVRSSNSDLVREYIRRTTPTRQSSVTSARPASSDDDSKSYNSAMEQGVWTYLAVAVLVFLLLWWIAYSKFQDVHIWAQLPAWLANPVVFALVTLTVLLLAGYVVAHVSRDNLFEGKAFVISLGVLFLLISIMLLLVAYLVYRSHSFTAAFYISLVTLVLSAGLFAVSWRHRRAVALMALPLVVYLAMLVYYLWYMADESADCLTGCHATYGVEYV